MPAKAPMYLKTSGKAGGSSKNSRKLREILSADMISPPLGDLRHTAHVGRGGNDDMFGDTSFLKKNTREVDHYPFGSQTLGRNKKTNIVANTFQVGEAPALHSASSLPHLNAVGVLHSETETHSSSSSKDSDHRRKNSSQDEDPTIPMPARFATIEGPPKPRRQLSLSSGKAFDEVEKIAQTQPKVTGTTFSRTSLPNDDRSEEESWNFEVDLGPPLLDEVMEIINLS